MKFVKVTPMLLAMPGYGYSIHGITDQQTSGVPGEFVDVSMVSIPSWPLHKP